jgi:predicted kinase
LTQELRSKLINLLAPYNPSFKILYIETSRQNIAKHREEDIPKAVMDKMYRLLDIPLPTEAHEVEYFKWL